MKFAFRGYLHFIKIGIIHVLRSVLQSMLVKTWYRWHCVNLV